MQEQSRQILDRIGELRGSPPKGDVQMNLISRQAAIDYYRGDGQDEEDEAETNLQQEVYQLLGLIPESSDLEDTFVDVLGAGITGFYEPRLKAFFLLDDQGGLNSFNGKTTVVHELTHALQDQYYDLDATSERIGEGWDAQRAFTSVIEGDAVTTESLYSGSSLRSKASCFALPPPNRGSIPYVVTRDINSWYDDGSCFVQQVEAQGMKISAIFDRLPTTTEQLLHPEKYLSNEAAKPVFLTDLTTALGSGWTKSDENDLGEYGLQNVLMQNLSHASSVDRSAVQAATAGWGGDRWQLYRNDDQRLLQVTTVWDSEDEAHQFWDALFTSLLGTGSTVSRQGNSTEGVFSGAQFGREWRGSWKGDSVVFVVAKDAGAADRAIDAVKPGHLPAPTR